MANHTAVKHGMLTDLREYLLRNGWTEESPVGYYEVLRMRKIGYPRPLLVHNRLDGGAYSIDGRDMKVYRGWKRDRRERGLHPDWCSKEEMERYKDGKG